MYCSNNSSRREFLQIAGLTTGVGALALPATGSRVEAEEKAGTPAEMLKKLIAGNKRFVEGNLLHPGRSPKDFAPLAEGQKPFAAIISCADSRVPPEVVFDQGVGDLFIVRVAGNIVNGAGPLVKGSIEFAVAELGVRLILVLAHTQCGAVKAAIEHFEAKDALPGSIGDLIRPIGPAVVAAKGLGGDKLANVTRINVLEGVKRLQALDPILAPLVKEDKLKIVGGVYDLKSGAVELY